MCSGHCNSMMRNFFTIALAGLFSLPTLTSASPLTNNGTCTSPSQRKAWHILTDSEKSAYITAEKCLMTSPARSGIPGAKTRWDELQWVHIVQSNVIHGVGGFLPWHRMYVGLHEYLLQTECGYTAGVPYWDEALDSDGAGSLADAAIWGSDNLSFGTNGTSSNNCVTDGPFANTTLRLNMVYGVTDNTEYCLSRSWEKTMYRNSYWSWANSTYIDECMTTGNNYTAAYPCWKSDVHSSAHLAIGGTIEDQSASPGDPVFFLHHTNLDRLWWRWQEADLPARLTQMGGQNIPDLDVLVEDGWAYPDASVTDYFGDEGGNVTTLNHNLWMVGIVPNATVADVMDIRGSLMCAEYVDA